MNLEQTVYKHVYNNAGMLFIDILSTGSLTNQYTMVDVIFLKLHSYILELYICTGICTNDFCYFPTHIFMTPFKTGFRSNKN